MKIPLIGAVLVSRDEIDGEDLEGDEPEGERGEVPGDRLAIGRNQGRGGRTVSEG